MIATRSDGPPYVDSGEDKGALLIVDDDEPFRTRLARAMERRGYQVTSADSVESGIAAARTALPAFAVVDLRLAKVAVWTWSRPCARRATMRASWS